MPIIPFNDPRFTHLAITPQPAKAPTLNKDGTTMTITTEAGKDWWRILERHSYDSPVISVDAPNVELGLAPEIQNGSDQAQLLLYISPKQWIKTGLEYDQDQLWAGVVVTNPWSDWSLQKVDSRPSTFKITYTTSSREIKVFYGDEMIRNVHAFGSGEDGEVMKIGVTGCSPLGEGTEATFKNFTLDKVQ